MAPPQGHSHATLDAKRRDLQRFLSFYQGLYKHDRPEEWFVSVTKAFLKALQREKLAQASLVRIYATVRHFARWLHRKFPGLFPLGCPTEGVKPPAEPTPDWKGITRLDEIRLFAAAQTLRASPPDHWQFVFLDAERPAYAHYLPGLIRTLAPGGTLAVDNVLSHADELVDFTRLIEEQPGLTQTVLEVGAGLRLAVKEHG